MRNPFRINPAVKLICDKVEALPWNEVHQTKLYSAWESLTENATRWEKRKLLKAEKISKEARTNEVYLKAIHLVVSGEYTDNRWGEEKKASISSGAVGLSAIAQASDVYNQTLRQKYLHGQATHSELYGHLTKQVNCGTTL